MRKPPRQRTGLKPHKLCMFCGASGANSEEHVFPNWLNKVGYGGHGIREYGDIGAMQQQEGGIFTKRIRVVCKRCNSGWMSDLEEAAKPLLLQCFNAGPEKITLDEYAQRVLATWAFKTTAVLSRVTRRNIVPIGHARQLFATGLPPRQTMLWIGSASETDEPLGLLKAQFHCSERIMHASSGELKEDMQNYSARLRLLNVVLDIHRWQSQRFDLEFGVSSELERMLLPIWPARDPKIWWPPTESLDTLGGVDGLISVPLSIWDGRQ
jgi:hypothetical protein